MKTMSNSRPLSSTKTLAQGKPYPVHDIPRLTKKAMLWLTHPSVPNNAFWRMPAVNVSG